MSEVAKLLQAVTNGGIVPSEHVDMMWSTLVTGIVVVFLILLLLVFILWGMGKILNIQRKPKNVPSQNIQSTPAPAASAPVSVQEIEEDIDEDDEEIIAVIAAAIAAYGAAEGKQYKIASVKRKEKALRSSWGRAGVSENTRPF